MPLPRQALTSAINPLLPDREINATLLRADPNNPLQSLFQYIPNPVQAVDNPDRNPFFRYQGLERLSNLVTTRSNVYTVWITVGYFEVKPKRPKFCYFSGNRARHT